MMENNHSSSRKEKKEKKHKKEKKDKKDKKDKRTAVDSVLTMLGEGTGQKAITSAITEKFNDAMNSDGKKQSTQTSSLEDEETSYAPLNQLLFGIEQIIVQGVSFPIQLHLHLYSAKKKQILTEDFVYLMTSASRGSISTLFKDITLDMLQSELWLVCKLYRFATVVDDNIDHQKLRIPVGCGVLAVDPFAGQQQQQAAAQFDIEIFKIESYEWSSLPEYVAQLDRRSAKRIAQLSGVDTWFYAAYSNLAPIVLEYPRTNTIDISSETIRENQARNDFYVSFISAELLKSRSCYLNVEIKDYQGASVRDASVGFNGVLPASVFCTAVRFESDKPYWNDCIKVHVPEQNFLKCCLKIDLMEIKDKDQFHHVASAFLELDSGDGNAIKDGQHTLTFGKPSSAPTRRKAGTLRGLAGLASPDKKYGTLSVRTNLTSTRVHQVSNVMKVTRWREHRDTLKDILSDLTYNIEPLNLLKFLFPLLDGLFQISDEYKDMPLETNEIPLLSFDAIVFVLSSLLAFNSFDFRPVLDSYIKTHFTGKFAHVYLYKGVSRYLFEVDLSANLTKISHTLKAFPHLFKFMKQSVVISPPAEYEELQRVCENNFGVFLEKISYFMTQTTQHLLVNQLFILKSFHLVILSIREFFPFRKLNIHLAAFVDALQCPPNFPAYSSAKLTFLQWICSPHYLQFEESPRDTWAALFPVVMKHVKFHGRKTQPVDEQRQALYILLSVLSHLQKVTPSVSQWNEVLLSLIVELTGSVPVCMKEGSICVLSILQSCSETDFTKFIQGSADTQARDFWIAVVNFFGVFLRNMTSLFERHWLALQMLSFQTILRSLKLLEKFLSIRVELLRQNVVNPFIVSDGAPTSQTDSFSAERHLWSSAIDAIFELILHPRLQLKQLSSSERKALKMVYGDLREGVLELIIDCCDILDTEQFLFDNLLTNITLLLTVDKKVVQKTAVNLLFWLVENEIELTQSLSKCSMLIGQTITRIINDKALERNDIKEKLIVDIARRIEEEGKENELLLIEGRRFVEYLEEL